MIDTVLNLLFRCSHRRLTRPLTPVGRAGVPHADTYVVCLDCGKQFSYDLKEMRVGKPIDQTHDESVMPPNMPKPRPSKLKYALLAALPVALIAGAAWKKKPEKNQEPKGG